MHKMHNFLEVDFLSNFDTPIFLKVDFFSDSDTSIFLVIHSDIWRIVDKGSLIDWIVGRYDTENAILLPQVLRGQGGG